MKKALLAIGFCLFCSTAAFAQADPTESSPCNLSPSIVYKFKADLNIITGVTSSSMTPADHNGGLFFPNRMWGALVDRQGNICAVFNTGNDPWPGSRDIAVAKAGTANDFSNSALALSTANLYGPTQPGGSLYGLNNSNPYNPFYNAQGSLGGSRDYASASASEVSVKVPGGIITFGGGVALYQGGQVIGGFGVSGDTSCADHAIAYRTRALAGYAPPSGFGVNNGTDNIAYYAGPGPGGQLTSPNQVVPSEFAQPHCTAHDVTP
ncbi:MAG TPA: heme-binding protein [Methylovirgula sp.]|nr:heme-binding protein [Methylovirgula sp.]